MLSKLSKSSKERIKALGFYVLMILVIVRFVAVPLDNSVKEKKMLRNDCIETYRAKALLIKKHKHEQKAEDVSLNKSRENLVASLYQKDSPYTLIQSEILQGIISMAEKYGITVINFELPEAAVTKDISEVSVLIRLKGGPKTIIDLLKDMEKWKKLLSFKNFEIMKSEQEFVFTMTVASFRMEK